MRRNLLHITAVVLVFGLVSIGWAFFLEQIKQNSPATVGQEGLIRLHVLANSDKPEDQQLKLKVRDAVIAYLAPRLEHLNDPEAARLVVLENQSKLNDIAQRVVKENGDNYPVSTEFGLFDFPVKSYGNFVLPAGKYEAVRILIGNAEGKNWWCVLFPPLCFIDITNAAATPIAEVNKDSNNKENSSKIEMKWKVAELFK
ncbi:stage II sporulation protein R [Dendrosporobacter sp. 1207_IL3150]|uniref:stage II sporulation protein R n=1 Tax=Dendrosporobacter sp. 1207_IL3150 TaxID=3084054 RepID=UPI002FDA23D6